MSHLAADNIRQTVEKQHIQYVESLCNAYAAFIAPKIQAHLKSLGATPLTNEQMTRLLATGINAIKRANARKEKSS